MISLNMICPKIASHDLHAVIALLFCILFFFRLAILALVPPETTCYNFLELQERYFFACEIKSL